VSIFVPPGYFELSWIFDATVGSPPYVTTLGVHQVDPDTPPVKIASRGFAAMAIDLSALIADEATLIKCVASYEVDGVRTSVESTQTPEPMTGGFTFSDVRSAVVIQKHTARPGRQGRGRMFMPLSAQLDHVSVDGVVDFDLRSDWQAAMDSFADTLAGAETSTTAPCTPALFHNDHGIDPDDVLYVTVATRTGMIRDRR
jgi:hypothetical protein